MARLQSAGGLSPGKDENEASTPFGALLGVFALVNRSLLFSIPQKCFHFMNCPTMFFLFGKKQEAALRAASKRSGQKQLIIRLI